MEKGAMGGDGRDEDGLTLVSSPFCVAPILRTMVMFNIPKI